MLSLQLPFATISLIHFTSDPNKMGVFANRAWVKICAWAIEAVIVALNLKLVFDELSGWPGSSPAWLWVLVMIPLTLVMVVLAYITFSPFFRPGREWDETITTDAHRVAGAIKVAIAALTPMTRPSRLIRGPPLLPGIMAALVCR